MKVAWPTWAIQAVAAVAFICMLTVSSTERYTEMEDNDDELWLEDKLKKLRQHLEQVDPELAVLLQKVKDVKIMRGTPGQTTTVINGKYQHRSGILWIANRGHRGRRRSRPSMLMTLIHEIAHAVHGPVKNFDTHMPHGEHWSSTWMTLLGHVTQHLGWEVEVRCSACTFYGLCEASQCPRCMFAQETCAPYRGGSPSDFKRKAAWDATKPPA
jgi:hypothetical protein